MNGITYCNLFSTLDLTLVTLAIAPYPSKLFFKRPLKYYTVSELKAQAGRVLALVFSPITCAGKPSKIA